MTVDDDWNYACCGQCSKVFRKEGDNWFQFARMHQDRLGYGPVSLCSKQCAKEWVSQETVDVERLSEVADNRKLYPHSMLGVAPGINHDDTSIVVVRVMIGGQKDEYRMKPEEARRMSVTLIASADFADGLIDGPTYDERVGLPNN